MKRARIVAVASALVLTGVGIAPARADSTVVERSLNDALRFLWGCDGLPPTSDPTAFRVSDHDPTPELGEVSWGLMSLTAPVVETGPGAESTSVADVENQQLRVYRAGTGEAFASIPSATTPGRYWFGRAPLTGDSTTTPAWTTVAVTPATTYTWQLWDLSDSSNIVQVDTAPSSTIANLIAAKGDPGDYAAGMLFGCDLPLATPFMYDGLATGASGSVTTHDFEKLTSSVTMGATPAPITAGGSAAIKLATTSSQLVSLQARSYGSSTWRTIKSLSGASSTTSVAVKPVTQTSYRWRIAPASCCLAATSSMVTVKVRTKVTARAVDASLAKGKTLVVKGTTYPKKGGARVWLWRKTPGGATLLATSTVKSDGTYQLSHRFLHADALKVFTTVAAAKGNLAGQSPSIGITIR